MIQGLALGNDVRAKVFVGKIYSSLQPILNLKYIKIKIIHWIEMDGEI